MKLKPQYIGNSILCSALILLVNTSLCGCAIHYFDPQTCTEHLWGIGHMKMKIGVNDDKILSLVRGTEILGIAIGAGKDEFYLLGGWRNLQRIEIIAKDTSLRFEWPSSDFASVRVGSDFPINILSCKPLDKTNKKSVDDHTHYKETKQ